ncbi:YopX family protein [Lysinibacillus sp. LZ02]|uniref:YopX family protein n=1 Tax=Lysinibacillus sp. LZ02 TaxID=3420668 RepID=UPI003D363657
MREIKFRAWDKKTKELFPVHELTYGRNGGHLTTVKGYTHDEKDIWNVYGGHFMMYANAPRYVLMQYTGLKDKNGKEIYEGDILTDNGDEGPIFVEYSQEHAGFVFVDKFDVQGPTLYTPKEISYEIFEIIGNIYENPELLEVSE